MSETLVRYQSEAELERDFIQRLQVRACDYLPITSEAQLIANLRQQLEALNKVVFSDGEWQRFFSEKIAFAKHTLLNILTRYCVFDVDRKLLVMRPYPNLYAEFRSASEAEKETINDDVVLATFFERNFGLMA